MKTRISIDEFADRTAPQPLVRELSVTPRVNIDIAFSVRPKSFMIKLLRHRSARRRFPLRAFVVLAASIVSLHPGAAQAAAPSAGCGQARGECASVPSLTRLFTP